MPRDKSKDGSGAAMIGTGAAATMLDVHRSTINYAVKHGNLEPDDTTPSGQLRFYISTIERFGARRRVRKSSADSSARATDDTARQARLDLVRRLATELASGKDASEVCQIAVTGIRQIKPDICLAVVVQRDPTQADSLHAVPLAGEGLTSDLLDEVRQVGRTEDFTFRKVLESGVMLRCDDTHDATLPPASRWFFDELHIQSYCVLPLKVQSDTTGLLILHSTQTYAFDGVMVTFLEHIAGLLAAAVNQQQRASKLQDYLKYAAKLMSRGMEEYAAGGAATYERLEQMLGSMAEEYCVTTNAYTVICTAGPPAPGMLQDERVREVAEIASRTHRLTVEKWLGTLGQITCVGTPVQVGKDTYAGMAAAWHEQRRNWLADYDLLRIFAGACVLALSGLRRAQ